MSEGAGGDGVAVCALSRLRLRLRLRMPVGGQVRDRLPRAARSLALADCVDQSCDGQTQVLINDLDDSFSGLDGSDGLRTSIFGAEEFDYPEETGTVVPITMITRSNGTRITAGDISIGRGIARIVDEDPLFSQCVWKATWLAWRCHTALQHRMMVIESMDWDTELRRLSAVAILSRGTSELPNPSLRPEALGAGGNNLGNGAGYMQLLAGPMDHGWCAGA